MMEQKIEDILAIEEGKEDKEQDETEAMTQVLLGKIDGRKEAKSASCFTEKLVTKPKKQIVENRLLNKFESERKCWKTVSTRLYRANN